MNAYGRSTVSCRVTLSDNLVVVGLDVHACGRCDAADRPWTPSVRLPTRRIARFRPAPPCRSGCCSGSSSRRSNIVVQRQAYCEEHRPEQLELAGPGQHGNEVTPPAPRPQRGQGRPEGAYAGGASSANQDPSTAQATTTSTETTTSPWYRNRVPILRDGPPAFACPPPITDRVSRLLATRTSETSAPAHRPR